MPDQNPNLEAVLLQKATGIGPPQIGATLEPESPIEKLMSAITGMRPRPASVAAQDPYGTEAFLQGKGPLPVAAGLTKVSLEPPMALPSKEGSIRGGKAMWELLKQLTDFKPAKIDLSRVISEPTARYIPPAGHIVAPEGFTIPIRSAYGTSSGNWSHITRAPELEALRNVQQEQLSRFKPPSPDVQSVSSIDELKDIVKSGAPSRERVLPAGKTNAPIMKALARKTTKLNEDLVRAIRAEAATTDLNKLAKKYNVSESTVGDVVKRDSWAWVK